MPDAWGIDQLFPVLPLEGLDQVPERRAVLLDITCDSDGAIDHYIDGDGIATTMPMPEYDPENPPMLGFFMVGAYQEILGNMHNLFGDTEAVDVFVFPDGSVEVELSDEGRYRCGYAAICATGSENAVNAFPRPGKTDGSGRCVAAAVP
ncbi:hypothetical protein LFZ20_14255 [Salmonella enterica subsp. enterica serovar Johannesburg str. SA20025782]|nr:hypothetical protein LFZ20_14255 [Salmonella enterica subsp. enterica serovar Johannesburg str. SA20025782]